MHKIDYKLKINQPTLFYPCSGNDLILPITCFSDVITNFYFVDIGGITSPCITNKPPLSIEYTDKSKSSHRARELQLGDRYSIVEKIRCNEHPKCFRDTFFDMETGRNFYVHRWTNKGEEAIKLIPSIGIFFYRGDNPVEGEGSSGVLWLGKDLFGQVLKKMSKGGLVVTDGSNNNHNGPRELSRFWHNNKIGESAKDKVKSFEYEGREFVCIGYIGEKYGPTLVWQLIND